MTSLEKLDYVLEKTHHQRNYNDVIKDLCNDTILNIDEHNLKLLLYKLQRDGYIDFMAGNRYSEGQQASEGLEIRRNFEGDLFVEAGGYRQQNINRLQAITDTNDRNQRMEKNEENLVDWTRILAVRTNSLMKWTKAVALGAIGLVVWEIIAFLWEHFSCL